MTAEELCRQCSFLCLDSDQVCTMTKGGVYLPLPEHIEIFCKTPHFPDCHQHIRGSKLSVNAERNGAAEDSGRRKFRRAHDMLSLVISDCDDSGAPCQLIDDRACTIDISPDGMRFESNRQLDPNNLIAFTFGTDFSSPNISGIGRIRWSVQATQPETFHSGLAFIDDSIREAVGLHMGISF